MFKHPAQVYTSSNFVVLTALAGGGHVNSSTFTYEFGCVSEHQLMVWSHCADLDGVVHGEEAHGKFMSFPNMSDQISPQLALWNLDPRLSLFWP